MKMLHVESEGRLREYPLTPEVLAGFCLDADQVKAMEGGEILWSGDTAFSVENQQEIV